MKVASTQSADKATTKAPSYDQVAKPFLAKHCLSCHGPDKQAGSLSFSKADANSLQDDRPTWENVLLRVKHNEMPPKKLPQPSTDEKKAFLTWLEAELAKSACSGPIDPGRVTLRRLNRVEYNNTIRDLLGLDIQPAEDFPADDVGYGFDNIGDVLAFSPLLFEKYLAAAERIVEKSFGGELPPLPPRVVHRGVDMKASAKSDSFRDRARAFIEGELVTQHRFSGDGGYVFTFRAFGLPIDREPVRIAILLDDKEIFQGDLRAAVPNRPPPNREFKAHVQSGWRKLAVKIVNPKNNPKEADPKKQNRGVLLASIEVQGPMPKSERAPTEAYKRIMIAAPSESLTEKECARRICTNLARRAFRRPPVKDEIERLIKFVDLAKEQGDSFEKGIQLAVQAVLVSPHFLFKVERDRKLLDKPYQITEHELATRLSYFLWSSMPDEELFQLADRGELRKQLAPQVRRMLQDSKVRALSENFAGQWLQVRNLKSIALDPKLFPRFDDELRAALAKETTLFFEAIVRENRSILDFLDGDFTYVNDRLARYYGLPAVRGAEFRRVSLKGTNRGGILTQAGVLAVTSNPTRTSPVKRGKFIMENILNSPPPPPPPEVPEFKDEPEAMALGSLRKRFEMHRANPECAVCHERMDQLGFAFEHFDAVGLWRPMDGAFDIDASGALPDGRTFKDATELRARLREKPEQFRRCLVEKLLTYALGRGIEAGDRCAVDVISEQCAAKGDAFSELILSVVMSEPFQMRTPSTRGDKKK